MSVAAPIPLLQHLPDVNVTPAVGVDEYALVYDHDTAKFVLRAPAAPFAGILATGATTGATSQAQAFTLGVVSPFDAPAADSTTAWQVRKADKTTAVVTVDTTNVRVGIGTTAPNATLDVNRSIADVYLVSSNASYYSLLRAQNSSGNYAQLLVTGASYVLPSRASFIAKGLPWEFMTDGDVASGGTQPIYFTTGGYDATNRRMTILATGLVGIGTTSPATALHVVGAATITGGIRPAADSTTALQLQNASGTSVLNVDTTNARVGIGTAAPAAKLHLNSRKRWSFRSARTPWHKQDLLVSASPTYMSNCRSSTSG